MTDPQRQSNFVFLNGEQINEHHLFDFRSLRGKGIFQSIWLSFTLFQIGSEVGRDVLSGDLLFQFHTSSASLKLVLLERFQR